MKTRPLFLILLIALLLAPLTPAVAQTGTPTAPYPPLLIPIGGGYNPQAYAGLVEALAGRAQNGQVRVLILPIAYASSAAAINDIDRTEYLKIAETRRQQMEETCRRAIDPNLTCSTLVAPILSRSDAEDPAALDYFTPDLTGVLILGGDPAIAMQVIGGTPVEQAMDEAYQRGVIIAGTSAGNGIQSQALLAGYNPGFNIGSSLQFGAVDVWHSPDQRGLSFGLRSAILDEHFFERGRVGRLLNAISQTGVPHVGLGVDTDTGLYIAQDEIVERIFGLFTAAVFDAQTYHAAEAVQYSGDQHLISLRNVLVHLLAPGDTTYDLRTRQHSLVAPPIRLERRYTGLVLPAGAGNLLLTSDLLGAATTPALSGAYAPLINRFVNSAGGTNARLLIVATGFADPAAALATANQFKALLGVPAQVLAVSSGNNSLVQVTPDITGLVLIGQDQSLLDPSGLTDLVQAWGRGLPLLADGAAAALSGQAYAAYGPTPADPTAAQPHTQGPLLVGEASLRSGLGLVTANLAPHVEEDNRWGQLFALAYNFPSRLAIGLPDGAALEITREGASAAGSDGLYVLDLSLATLSRGTPLAEQQGPTPVGETPAASPAPSLDQQRAGMVIVNGLLDVFAPGESLAPSLADTAFSPISAPTPVLVHAAPPPLPTAIPTLQAVVSSAAPTVPPPPTATRILRTPTVRVPRPTPSNVPEGLATEPLLLNAMILFGIVVAIPVAVGIWVNRRRVRLR